MVLSSELRIGNYVIDIYTGKWLQVKASDVHPKMDGVIDPIEIDIDVLWKCSKLGRSSSIAYPFEFTISKRNWVLSFYFSVEQKLTRTCIDMGNYIHMELPHIKYLHHLQNLYFSLTGEELNIKL